MTRTLGIDLGTQGLKVLVLDSKDGVLATASRSLDCIAGLPAGHSEQDPEDWLQALRGAMSDLRQHKAFDAEAIDGIGVSGQQHGLVPLDKSGAVIRPAKLWNDVSSATECDALIARFGKERLFESSGNYLPPGFTGGKLAWLHAHEPEHFARLDRILLPHDYLNFYLSGRATCEAGDASGTGFFDVRNRRFAGDVLEALAPGLQDCLPELIGAGEAAGELCKTAATELGLRAGTLISSGGGDNMMAAIGAGAVRPGVVVMSLGTSGTVFACADTPVCDPQGEIAAFCDSTGHWLPLGCTMNATVSTELSRHAFGLSLADFEREASAAKAGSDGLLCLPFFTGERSPNLPEGTGSLLGLTATNFTPGNLLRATMEGATFALARLFDRLQELGLDAKELRLTGGGSKSPLWQKIAASCTELPVITDVHPDAAALGGAIQALWTLRRRDQPDYSCAACFDEVMGKNAGDQVAPNPDWSATYRERRDVYESAVSALTPLFPQIRG